MAAAAVLPSSAGEGLHNKSAYYERSSKSIERSKGNEQPGPLDVALLCSKLEAHSREQSISSKEQEVLRRAKEKRNAVRNGSYVPRHAAASFSATATQRDTTAPLRQRRQRRSEAVIWTEKPPTIDERICVPQKQLHTSLNFAPRDSDHVVHVPVPVTSKMKQEPAPTMRHAAVQTEDTITMTLPNNLEDDAQSESEGMCDLITALATIDPCETDGRCSLATALATIKPLDCDGLYDLAGALASIRPEFIDPFASDKPADNWDVLKLDKRDSMSPAANGQNSPSHLPELPLLASLSHTPQRRKSSARSNISTRACEERGRARYRPGDAAKRRSTLIEPSAREKEDRPLSHTNHSATRFSRFLEQDVHLEAAPQVQLHSVIPEIETPPELRPRAATDRPDWSQRDNDVRARHTIQLFSNPLQSEVKTVCSKKTIWQGGILSQFAESKPPERKVYSGPQNDHLIADAVKIIKQEQKMKRRTNVMNFLLKM